MLEPDTVLLASDVARVCRVSSATVRWWERSGHLPATRTLGGVRLFSGRDVLRLCDARLASHDAEVRTGTAVAQ